MKVICAALATAVLICGCGGTRHKVRVLSRYEKIAFEDYIKTDMGVSLDPEDYVITETIKGTVVEVSICPVQYDLDHAGGKGRFGFDVLTEVDKSTRKVLKRIVGT